MSRETILNMLSLCDGRTAHILCYGIRIDGELVHTFKAELREPVKISIATPDGIYLDGRKVVSFDAPEGEHAIAYADKPLVINNDNRRYTQDRHRPPSSHPPSPTPTHLSVHANNGSVGMVMGNMTVIHHK